MSPSGNEGNAIMNTVQYHKWKEDTFNALVSSGIYTEIEAGIITRWFDRIKGQTERDMFGNELIEALSEHWGKFNSTHFVYKTLTARAWLYADAILQEYYEENPRG